MTLDNTWHNVKPSDQARIQCDFDVQYDRCGKPAVECEHNENRIGISFGYYCADHAEIVKRTGKAYSA